MKLFEDLTDEELVNLSEEEVQRYIDLGCAYEGVPMAIDPPEPIKEWKPVLDLQLKEVPSFLCDCAVAQQIQELFDANHIYTSDYGSNVAKVVVQGDYTYPTIKAVQKQSTGQAEHEKIARSEYDKKKSAYNEQKAVYDDIEEQRGGVIKDIWSQVYAAGNRVNDLNQKKAEWSRYLDLAEGDKSVAKNFFVNRYDEETFEKLGIE